MHRVRALPVSRSWPMKVNILVDDDLIEVLKLKEYRRGGCYMIKTIVISFEFEGKTYVALACIRGEKDKVLTYKIHTLDSFLERILPREDQLLHLEDKVAAKPHPMAERLRSCIDQSVQAHMQLL